MYHQKMNKQITKTIVGIFVLVLTISFASAIVVDADFATLYPGESERITVEIDNNGNFDIEDVSVSLNLAEVPFTAVGSSEKDIDDLDEDDDDTVSFTLRASTDATPGDYNIPYSVRYTNAENDSEDFEEEGTFGIRITARTEIDFAVEVRGNAIVGQEGRISLEIINKGLGEIKSLSVQILPGGFELLSKSKVFVGTIDADDTDLASFDVIYKATSPTLSAKIEYKDFDNKKQEETVNLSFKVYTREEALELGLVKKSNTQLYFLIFIILLIVWLIYRKIKKRRKQNRRIEK